MAFRKRGNRSSLFDRRFEILRRTRKNILQHVTCWIYCTNEKVAVKKGEFGLSLFSFLLWPAVVITRRVLAANARRTPKAGNFFKGKACVCASPLRARTRGQRRALSTHPAAAR